MNFRLVDIRERKFCARVMLFCVVTVMRACYDVHVEQWKGVFSLKILEVDLQHAHSINCCFCMNDILIADRFIS